MAGVILGYDIETGWPVEVADRDRQDGTYVIGKTGSGKTTLIESLALQDMTAGHGFCVIEPHSDLIQRILAQVPVGSGAMLQFFFSTDEEPRKLFRPGQKDLVTFVCPVLLGFLCA